MKYQMGRTKTTLLFLITTFVGRTSSQHYPFTFEIRTVPLVILRDELQSPVSFALSEEKLKLCMYATMVAGLPYLDYNYKPQWHKYVPSSPFETFDHGMYCATLPTMYVLQKAWTSSPPLQITLVHPKIMFEFDARIIVADFVIFKEDLKEEAKKFRLAVLDVEDRRNVCVSARQFAQFRFLDHNVDEAQPYEFKYSNWPADIGVAIPCPTLPQLYVRENPLTKRLELVFQRSLISYDFEADMNNPAIVSELPEKSYPLSEFVGHSLTRLNEEERANVCALARKYFGPYLVPSIRLAYVPEARMYTFQYSEEEEKLDEVAILCPTSSLYLRSIESDGMITIKLTFGRTEADRYTYNVETVSNLIQLSTKNSAEHRKKLEWRWKQNRERGAGDEHRKETLNAEEFARLSTQSCWNLCLAAQRYVRSKRDNNFIFTTQQSVLFNVKLLVVPEFMSPPRFYQVKSQNAIDNEIDIFIECSQWPRMYLSPGFKGININLFERELSKSNFDKYYANTSEY